jgi:hypothetical protein
MKKRVVGIGQAVSDLLDTATYVSPMTTIDSLRQRTFSTVQIESVGLYTMEQSLKTLDKDILTETLENSYSVRLEKDFQT